jgi:23S rRNA (uridine2552-2'-O)-methyltransferase
MKDKFTTKAFSEGYLARSIYKLKDIQKRYRIIKQDDRILDLGAAPGSWSQFAKEKGAKITAIDLNEIKAKQVKIIKIDVFSDKLFEKLKKEYDLILSDLAPKTTGILKVDNELSYDLCKRALEISKKVLINNGNFLCKIFQSEFSEKFIKEIKKEFKIIKIIKPIASKKRSKEIYVLGIKKIKHL